MFQEAIHPGRGAWRRGCGPRGRGGQLTIFCRSAPSCNSRIRCSIASICRVCTSTSRSRWPRWQLCACACAQLSRADDARTRRAGTLAKLAGWSGCSLDGATRTNAGRPVRESAKPSCRPSGVPGRSLRDTSNCSSRMLARSIGGLRREASPNGRIRLAARVVGAAQFRSHTSVRRPPEAEEEEASSILASCRRGAGYWHRDLLHPPHMGLHIDDWLGRRAPPTRSRGRRRGGADERMRVAHGRPRLVWMRLPAAVRAPPINASMRTDQPSRWPAGLRKGRRRAAPCRRREKEQRRQVIRRGRKQQRPTDGGRITMWNLFGAVWRCGRRCEFGAD